MIKGVIPLIHWLLLPLLAPDCACVILNFFGFFQDHDPVLLAPYQHIISSFEDGLDDLDRIFSYLHFQLYHQPLAISRKNAQNA